MTAPSRSAPDLRAGTLTARVAALLAAGTRPEHVTDIRRSLGLPAGPAAVVAALEHRSARLPGLDPGDAVDQTGSAADALLVAGEGLPARLQQTWAQGGPLWLHHRGRALTDRPHVAVVGTRRATLDGLEIAERLGHDLARAGITVVSGMARGVDQAAHRGALRAGGQTIGVLGAGLEVDYPAGSATLRRAVADAGGLVTEYGPGHGIRHRTQFIARNRILVGLCDAVVVVEAGARSGALNSATWAAAFDRDVMVVPFSPSNRMAAGSLELLGDGAVPVRHAADVLAFLGHAGGPTAAEDDGPASPAAAAVPLVTGGPAARMLPLLGATPATPSALAAATDLTPREVLIGLSELEEAGLARRTHAGVIRAR